MLSVVRLRKIDDKKKKKVNIFIFFPFRKIENGKKSRKTMLNKRTNFVVEKGKKCIHLVFSLKKTKSAQPKNLNCILKKKKEKKKLHR